MGSTAVTRTFDHLRAFLLMLLATGSLTGLAVAQESAISEEIKGAHSVVTLRFLGAGLLHTDTVGFIDDCTLVFHDHDRGIGRGIVSFTGLDVRKTEFAAGKMIFASAYKQGKCLYKCR